jgi:hypothetical protein
MKRTLAWMAALAAFAGFAAFAQAADDTAEKKEPKELVGYIEEQADGTFFNLAIEGNNFVLRVYNKEKTEEQALPWDRARLQYDPNTTRRQTTLLNRAGDGKSMTSPHVVKHPYAFNFWLFLFKEGSSEVDKNVAGRLVQMDAADGKSISAYDRLPPDQRPGS